jgi:alpha-D-ribose 1-methylphosphonate 5-triphosphate synthase subunit PhnG
MENKKVDIEMADMIGKTYFKVATWYNQDFNTDQERQEALKHVCAEILQQVLEDTFLQLDGISKTEVKTVSNDTPKKVINQTSGGTGKMFTINEDAITRALREQKEKQL